MTQIRVPVTGIVGPAGPPGANGGITAPFTADASVATDPVFSINNTSGSGGAIKGRATNSIPANSNPAIYAANGINTKRTFQIFGDNGIAQIGPTPPSTQWDEVSGAPVGSGGPTSPLALNAGLRMFNGPVGGDTQRYMISNASVTDGSATSGPNQDTMGMGGNSLGRIRVHMETASADGGWRFQTNSASVIPATPSGETATLSGTSVTFSSSVNGKISQGGAFYLYLIPSPYTGLGTDYNTPAGSSYGTGGFVQSRLQGFTLITLAPDGLSGTFTPFQQVGATMSNAINNYGGSDPGLDRNKGQMKWGTDSVGDFFGFQYTQPKNSTHTTDISAFGDYNLLIYPGGVVGRPDSGTDRGGFTSNTDIVVKQQGRSLRFGTSAVDANGDYKIGLWIAPHYGTDSAGSVVANGQLRAMAGSINTSRSSLYLAAQASCDSFVGGGGDIWHDGTNVYFRNAAGVTKTFSFV